MTDEQGSPSGAGHKLKTPLQEQQTEPPRLQLAQGRPILLGPTGVGLKHSASRTQEPGLFSLLISIQCSFIFLKAYDDLHSVGLMYKI